MTTLCLLLRQSICLTALSRIEQSLNNKRKVDCSNYLWVSLCLRKSSATPALLLEGNFNQVTLSQSLLNSWSTSLRMKWFPFSSSSSNSWFNSSMSFNQWSNRLLQLSQIANSHPLKGAADAVAIGRVEMEMRAPQSAMRLSFKYSRMSSCLRTQWRIWCDSFNTWAFRVREATEVAMAVALVILEANINISPLN